MVTGENFDLVRISGLSEVTLRGQLNTKAQRLLIGVVICCVLAMVLFDIALAEGSNNFTSKEQLVPISFEQFSIFDYHGSVIMILDPDTGKILYTNKAAEVFYGYTTEELIGLSMTSINTLSEAEVKQEMQNAITERRNYFEFKHRVKSGSIKNVDVYSYPITTQDGTTLLFSIVHDVTDQFEISQKQKQSRLFFYALLLLFTLCAIVFSIIVYRQKRMILKQHRVIEKERCYYQNIFHAIGEGVITLDLKSKIVFCNQYALDALEVQEDKIIGSDYDMWTSFEKNREVVTLEWLLESKGAIIYDLEIRTRTGKLMPVALNLTHLWDDKMESQGTVITFQDFSSVRSKEARIQYLSYHDQLTGLYNRRYFEDALIRIDTPRNLPLSLVMVDVNGLKMTNDAFGHRAGDMLLQGVAKCLKSVCRGDDIVARIGGDEFVLLLPRTDQQQLDRIMYNLEKEALRGCSQESVGDCVEMLSFAIGTVTKKHASEVTQFLLQQAEEAMYQHKLRGSQKERLRLISRIMEKLYCDHPSEKVHSTRVSDLLGLWGEKINLEPQIIVELRLLGTVHDIGKIVIENGLLDKHAPFTDSEWSSVKRHSESGYHILRAVEGYGAIAEAVIGHHEWWNGTGYPRGVSGDCTHWMSQMLSIVDAFEAMTAGRPHQPAISVSEAIEVIKKQSGTQFSPDWVERFIITFTEEELRVI